ncbi:MAG: hypothetical protein ACYDFT_00165 [Thermoplasmata archaeon]
MSTQPKARKSATSPNYVPDRKQPKWSPSVVITVRALRAEGLTGTQIQEAFLSDGIEIPMGTIGGMSGTDHSGRYGGGQGGGAGMGKKDAKAAAPKETPLLPPSL